MPSVAIAVVAPIVVLAAALTFIVILIYVERLATGGTWRRSFLTASIVTGVLIWGVTEVLGGLGRLNAMTLQLAWILVGAGAYGIYLRLRVRRRSGASEPENRTPGAMLGELSPATKWCLVFMGMELAALGVVAWAAAPNTWDSMTYHLSRVMHWQQNQSLNFYPTAIQRQLAFGPWAEMAVLQFQVLTNGDRLANFVQYFSLLGCAVGASTVAERLGADARGQAFAGLAVLTLPMAILQSTSTQNDLTAAFWCIVVLAFVVEAAPQGNPIASAAWLGAAIGLAALTKITALVFLAPPVAWYTLRLFLRRRARSFPALTMTALVVLVLLLPHSLRNLELYGNPLGMAPGSELSGYTNEALGVRPLVSNMVRTVGLQLATPWAAANSTIEHWIREAHYLVRIDPDDPATTWRGSAFDVGFSMYEDNAANPAHLLLILTGLALLIRDRARPLVAAWLGWVTSFVLFSLVVKWQPWNSRLILPLLIWGTTLAAVQLSRRLIGDWNFLPGLLLGALALPYIVSNPTRPLIGENSVLVMDRMHQYFANVPDDFETYARAAGILRAAGCREIGLVSTPETREYLLWATNRAGDADIRIEHVLVNNRSRRFATSFLPCAVVVAFPYDQRTISLNGEIFEEGLETERFHLFLAARAQP